MCCSYTVFVVKGKLPEPPRDTSMGLPGSWHNEDAILTENQEELKKRQLERANPSSSNSMQLDSGVGGMDPELEAALAASLAEGGFDTGSGSG
jgi:hypothetical protein